MRKQEISEERRIRLAKDASEGARLPTTARNNKKWDMHDEGELQGDVKTNATGEHGPG